MTQIRKLNEIENVKEFVENINDKELLIYEDIQGSKIFVNWNGEKIQIKPKSLNNYPINFIDLTMQVFYNQAYNYFLSLPDYVVTILNFCRYFKIVEHEEEIWRAILTAEKPFLTYI